MIVLLLFLALLTWFLFRFYSKVKSLPPGPFPLPLIGNVPHLALGILTEGGTVGVFRKWQKKYGNVYTWWLGPIANVNICDHQLATEAMVKKGGSFVSRPVIFLINFIRRGRGIVVSNGQFWTEQRRFALHTLRNFGLGRNLMQDRILLEWDYRSSLLEKEIESADGSLTFDPYQLIELTVGNIINRLLFSERFTDEDEKRFFTLKGTLDNVVEKATIFDFMMTEWNSQFPPFKQRLDLFKTAFDALLGFIKGQVEQRKKSIESGQHILRDEGEDFVDAFFIEMQREDHGSSFEEESLVVACLDLWAAGQETTTTTLYWVLTFLTLNPQCISKAQAEIDSVTGRNRSLSLTDRTSTPYLNAIILESQRLASLLPSNLWRIAEEDTVVGGYLIPKGTHTTAQLSLLLSDPQHLDEPEKFIPERFLDTNLEQFVVPFGIGKRACLGESLARAELYLLTGNLLQSYNLRHSLEKPPSMRARSEHGAIRKPQRFEIVISKRS